MIFNVDANSSPVSLVDTDDNATTNNTKNSRFLNNDQGIFLHCLASYEFSFSLYN
jgi:hypothetical protein